MPLTATELFGFDIEQQESLNKIQAIYNQTVSAPIRIPYGEFCGFNIEEAEALTDAMNWTLTQGTPVPGYVFAGVFNPTQQATLSKLPEFGGVNLGRVQAVSNRGYVPNLIVSGVAADRICADTRTKMKFGAAPITQFQFAFGGYYAPATNIETNIGNDQLVEMAVEITGAPIPVVRVRWGGATTTTLVNGTTIRLSDVLRPSDFGLTAAQLSSATFFLRQRRLVTVGQNLPAHSTNLTTELSYYSDGTSPSQVFAQGAMTVPPSSVTVNNGMCPLVVVGKTSVPIVSIIGIGDSITMGNNDGNTGDGGGGGWLLRAGWNVNGNTIPMTNVAIGSSTCVAFAANMTKRSSLFPYFSHAVYLYGTNDMSSNAATAAQVRAAQVTIQNALIAAGVRRIEGVPLIPRTASTDTWITTVNQTPITDFQTGGIERDALNNLMFAAAGTGGLSAILDLNSVVADGTALDKWRVTGVANFATTDGVHPSPAIHIDMASLATARFATYTV